MKKIFYLFTTVLMLNGVISFCDELGALKVYKARLPIYNKKRLRYMIYCAIMTRKADKIFADDVIIDLIKNDIDVNKIVYFEDIKPYKLGISSTDVALFWKDKLNSIGFICTSKATILQESKVTSGDKEVFFRSPQLDLNGVGFTADFNKRIIKVLQDVNIIIRMKKFEKGKKPSENDIAKVKADSMIMDMEKELVTLIGNVKVDDSDFNISCDRLVLDLKNNENDIQKKSDDSINPGGISKISCFGKVKIIRKVSSAELKKNGSQKAFSEEAVYLKSKEQIILTGKSPLNDRNPRIYRGNDMVSGDKIILWKDSERLQAFDNCLVEILDNDKIKPKKTELSSDFIDFDYNKNIGIFTGHVRVKNAKLKLICNEMTVFLQAKNKNKDVDSGKKEIEKIICVGSVSANDPRARVNCDRMVITLRDIEPGSKNTDGAISDSREIDLIKCFGSVYMLNKPQDANIKPTIINSNDAVLNIRGNVADLLGNVKIEESRFDLTCMKMKILTKDITPKQAAANEAKNLENPDDAPAHIGIGDSKELIKIICLEKVVMTRKTSEAQIARGDKGVYIINDYTITLTNTKGKPTLQRGPTLMEGNKIILWTNSEKLDIEEGTLKSIDGKGLLN